MQNLFQLTSDDDADDMTLDAILKGEDLPTALKRCRIVDAPITRGEYKQVVARCQHANLVMNAIYIQFGILCRMIEDVAYDTSRLDAVSQDLHEGVLDPLANQLLLGFPHDIHHVNSHDQTQKWISMTNKLLARWKEYK